MDRRRFFGLLAAAGVASVARKYFFAPSSGWIPTGESGLLTPKIIPVEYCDPALDDFPPFHTNCRCVMEFLPAPDGIIRWDGPLFESRTYPAAELPSAVLVTIDEHGACFNA